MAELKIKFDDKQQYQLDAINSTVSIFEKVFPNKDNVAFKSIADMGVETEDDSAGSGIFANPNQSRINKEKLYTNLIEVIKNNGISIEGKDKKGNAIVINHEPKDAFTFNFSVEMETGTGKTYTYLRTIIEMYKTYGLSKFIIVVPSVAIKEGILKTAKITKDHFKLIYPDVNFELTEYDSNNLNTVREFAFNDELKIMIITTGAFNKAGTNNIHKVSEKLGDVKPIDLLSGTNPVFILDEPQNMEAKNTKELLETFSPCFTLRYSATHKESYNLIYQLSPAEAYRQKLVKGIEVFSITEENDIGDDKVSLLGVSYPNGSNTPEASVKVFKKDKSGTVKETKVKLRQGEDIEELTGLSQYEGFIVSEIYLSADKKEEFVAFANGKKIFKGNVGRSDIDQFMKLQIQQTIKQHLDKKMELNPLGIKVLSLFFIDKVANYVDFGEKEPKIKNWFEKYFTEFMTLPAWSKYHGMYELENLPKIHDGYFSGQKGIADKDLDKKVAKGYTDKEAYDLIMKDKERLLSMDEPLEFIFSHSALREGWDNPNVFNICTLNETNSEVKKRQEIGRGVRLPVYQDGTRCTDPNINKLTVVVNQSYQDFVAHLQSELDEEGFSSKEYQTPDNARERITLEPKWDVLHGELWSMVWDKIKKQVKPQYNFDEDALIETISNVIGGITKADVPTVIIEAGTGIISYTDADKIEALDKGGEIVDRAIYDKFDNLVEKLALETQLTKSSLLKSINLKSDSVIKRYRDNPSKYVEVASQRIRAAIYNYVANVENNDALTYITIDKPDLKLEDYFKNINAYKDKAVKSSKSVYEYSLWDSETEKHMVTQFENNDKVKLYVKFPDGYRIPTPNGAYNPDWAAVIEIDGKLTPIIIETKNTLTGYVDESLLTDDERVKIASARAAYIKTLGIDYVVARDLKEALVKYDGLKE